MLKYRNFGFIKSLISTNHMYLWILLLVTITYANKSNSKEGVHEYCQLENFNATCAKMEVILMTEARYGRMKVGRCLSTSYYVGCHADVMNILDLRCSGRQTCLVNTLDAELLQTQPCRKDLMAYLEASYKCITVPQVDKCPRKKSLDVSAGEGHILLGYANSPNKYNCPWHVHVQSGQRVVFSAYNFQAWIKDETLLHQSEFLKMNCDYKLQFEDDESHSKIHICEKKVNIKSDEKRLNQVFTSSGSSVKVHMEFDEHSKVKPFILHYKAIGCGDIPVGTGMWMKRTENTVMVTCNRTKETWHLVCRDQSWIGELRNCSKDENIFTSESNQESYPEKFQYGILIAVFLGLILGVILGVIMLICMLHYKKRKQQRKNIPKPSPLLASNIDGKMLQTDYSMKQNFEALGINTETDKRIYQARKQINDSTEYLTIRNDGPDIIYTPRRGLSKKCTTGCVACQIPVPQDASTMVTGRLSTFGCPNNKPEKSRFQNIELNFIEKPDINVLNQKENTAAL